MTNIHLFSIKLITEQPLAAIGIKFELPFKNKYTTVIINDVETDISDEHLITCFQQFKKYTTYIDLKEQ